MRVTGGHISHYLEVTAELERLKDEAPDILPPEPIGDDFGAGENFYGPLSKIQLGRMVPGFIRVEVLESQELTQSKLDPIPVDLDFEFKDENGVIMQEQHTFDQIHRAARGKHVGSAHRLGHLNR